MAKGSRSGTGKSLGAIQKLLAERVQIERWLDRLNLAGDKTPEAVREKVSRDYRARLEEVIRELKTHGDELEAALTKARENHDVLAGREKRTQEQLEEAEVRHAVGEFDETKWRQVNAEFLQSLVRIREELKNADEEIAKLEEVVEGMSVAEQEAVAAADPSDDPSDDASDDVPPLPPAPAGASAKSPPPPPQDELAFLKSVTEDEKHGPSATRASGATRAIDLPPPPPPPAKPGVRVPTPVPERRTVKKDLGASGVAAIETGGQGKRLAATVTKSLKCKDCGTPNMPTEWYCEQCGAELSAI